MNPIVFVGPSLSGVDIPSPDSFDFRAPASEGDLYRAAREKPPAIGLIDGVFEGLPSVWHKEVLWALTSGVRVFGAASMGALRAAELCSFGMVGIGPIFDAYRRGRLTDDDEVAVLHAPAELGYKPITEALVDVRATLERAAQLNVVRQPIASRIARIAKSIFFKERTWTRILERSRMKCQTPSEIDRLVRWVPRNRVSQKSLDSILMLAAIRQSLEAEPDGPRPAFHFEKTIYWHRLVEAHRPLVE